MKTITLKPNKKIKVGTVTYWNLTAAPCSAPFTQPTVWEEKPKVIVCPPGKWVNPCGTNKALTVVSLGK